MAFVTSTAGRRLELMGRAGTWKNYDLMGRWLVAKTAGFHMLEWKTACRSMGID
jgi:hypothetical protein